MTLWKKIPYKRNTLQESNFHSLIQNSELINETNMILYFRSNSLSYFFPNCSCFIGCLFSITLFFRFMESACNYHNLHSMQQIYFTGQLYAFSVTFLFCS